MSCSQSPILPTARPVAASAIANEYPDPRRARSHCRSMYRRPSVSVNSAGTVVMSGM